MLKGYGILTCFHCVEKPDLYLINSQDGSLVRGVDQDGIFIKDKELDYALIPFENDDGFELENSAPIEIEQSIKMLGYPEYASGNSITITKCEVTGQRPLFKSVHNIYSVSTTVVHGSSGGPVLNSDGKVIGIIDAGEEDSISGFVGIKEILEDINKQKQT